MRHCWVVDQSVRDHGVGFPAAEYKTQKVSRRRTIQDQLARSKAQSRRVVLTWIAEEKVKLVGEAPSVAVGSGKLVIARPKAGSDSTTSATKQ